MTARILVVDDEKNIRRTLRMVLEGPGYEVLEAATGEEGLQQLDQEEVDLLILDVRLPGMGGIEALQKIRAHAVHGPLPVIMISGHASLAEAVNSVRLGATDFLEKPLDRDRVLVSVDNALERDSLKREVSRLREEAADRYQMIGEAPVMKDLYSQIEKVAPTKGRVLITGESGTGKELIARAVHRLSDRSDAPFVMLNCAAIPAELIESELFGHERGAFTGASSRKKGMFEQAHTGTLFLDEIGDMSLGAQAKVLRALQSGEITRVGSERPIAVDVRVLAATNKDLESDVAEGKFRDDLYFRLNVVPIRSPSLAERVEDIPRLAQSFLTHFCREYGGREKPADSEVFDLLRARPWPGNVRELKNVVERMVILSGERITAGDVPADGLGAASAAAAGGEPGPGGGAVAGGFNVSLSDHEQLTLREFRDRAESEYIVSTLRRCEWNISRAAGELGIERTNLHKKMRAFGIKREA
ncbi:MAG: sigma-54 dependent transcriptional regulator [Myxococcales bacterium]|nr:sigma-54 dependent transcriptional regulator [Myxococcales bacterium]